MRALAVAALLAVALGGCAGPRPEERLAWDTANCVRHAKEGPGGPSQMVGNNMTPPPASRRRANIAAAALMSGSDQARMTSSTPEAVYVDCMRVRGHEISGSSGRPLDPERIG